MSADVRATLATITVAVVAAGTVGVSMLFSSSYGSQLHDQQARIASYQDKIDVANAAHQSSQQVSDKAASGVDADRKAADDQRAHDVISAATTWSSLSDYNAARDKVKSLGVDANSMLLTGFLAPVKVVTQPNGTSTNPIDASGVNMHFVDMTTQVTAVSGQDYTYLGLVTVSSTSTTNKSSSSNGWMVVTYTTGADHTMSSIDLEPLINEPR